LDTDLGILAALVQHRVMTISQLAALLRRNPAALRRRLKLLADQNTIGVSVRRRPGVQGRPEHLVVLSAAGFDLLKTAGQVPQSAMWAPEAAVRMHQIEHELLINDLRVQLVQLERFLPPIAVRYFAGATPPTDSEPSASPFIHERFSLDGSPAPIAFIPDGVFSLTHRELGKTLLFFVEADRGTEPQTSAKAGRGLSAKLVAYQAYLRIGRYRRYEEVVGAKLRGFRLLILVDGSRRLAAVCRLVRESPPSDFVWVTSREQALRHGCWAPVWTPGGKIGDELHSILGTQMPCPCPSPSELPGLADGAARKTIGSQEGAGV